jgi:hypothetical protein
VTDSASFDVQEGREIGENLGEEFLREFGLISQFRPPMARRSYRPWKLFQLAAPFHSETS